MSNEHDPNGQVHNLIAREAPAERIIRALAGALEADMTSRAGVKEPDYRTRLRAAEVLLAYAIGRPIERQQVITAHARGGLLDDLENRMKRSPSLRDALRSSLERADEESESAKK